MQFNQFFIDFHLIPFLEKILIDVAKDEQEFLHSFIQNQITEREKESFKLKYFGGEHRNSAQIPFTGETKEDKAAQDEFIEYFHRYIQSISPDFVDRWKALVPTQDQENKELFLWPEHVKYNVHRMAYSIAGQFEKKRVNDIIDRQYGSDPKKAAKEKELNKKGLLMLVKTPGSQDFDFYIKKEDLKELKSAIPYISKPSEKTKAWLERKKPSGVYSSINFEGDIQTITEVEITQEDLREDFLQREKADAQQFLLQEGINEVKNIVLKENLKSAEIEVSGIKALLEIDDQNKTRTFTFLSGKNKGEKFSLAEETLKDLLKGRLLGRENLDNLYEEYKTRENTKSQNAKNVPENSINQSPKPGQDQLPLEKSKVLELPEVTISPEKKIDLESEFQPKEELPKQMPVQIPFIKEETKPAAELQYIQKSFEKAPEPIIPKLTPMEQKAKLAARKSGKPMMIPAQLQPETDQKAKMAQQILIQKKQQTQNKKQNRAPWVAAAVTAGLSVGTVGSMTGAAYFINMFS